ncbi:aromatic acid exporter family protein [Calidifontibacillus oryziterrae]|uniref:aromatic acid exporter family protein n=1 Tax=Calidifontibacillus oryziterrae TaxID=1191699 RepID=UPI0002D73AF0|nr:aromatic acid exporter family protein [Calidifontibacillus oryziterrae]
MERITKFFLIGGRVLKTGISVLITAWICHFFHLPAIFAVITAIVTIEPTASDSIKKGFVRFPAAAIGAAISMFLTFQLGETALTYALSAMFTIFLCHKLKLDDGIVVATITAVAMIPATNDQYLLAFITRLATTSIGIIISTIVNIIIFPPKFSPIINKYIDDIQELAASILQLKIQQITAFNAETKKNIDKLFANMSSQIDKTNKLCYYQREEFKYHKQKHGEIRRLHHALKRVNDLQLIAFHIGNLNHVNANQLNFSDEEREVVIKTLQSLIEILQNPVKTIREEHYKLIAEVDMIFREWKTNIDENDPDHKYYHHFTPQTIILYELLSISDVLQDLQQLYVKCKQ